MNKVSIVLPTYNGQDHIEKAIDSVMNQSYANWELIIVNDCSTDSTKQIAEHYAKNDERIRIITNEVNQKLPRSLNIGFENATGMYYTWTSDDNQYKDDAIKIMVDFLDHNLGYGMVYCDTILIDGDGNVIRENPLPEPERLILSNTVGACFLYRKKIADKIGGYDTDLFLAEDYEYWLRMYQNTNIKHLPEKLYYYRCHEKSLSSTRLLDIKHQTARVWSKHYDFIMQQIKDRKTRFQFFDGYIEYADNSERKDSIFRENRLYNIHYLLKNKKFRIG